MISIIVPYKNAEPWLSRCCDSLTRQDGDLEFVLVNDNSKDKSERIVAEYASRDKRFVMLDNQHKGGVSGARNTGLDNARGEWLTFLDADDVMVDNVWKIFDSAIRSGKGAVLYQFNHYRYYAKKNKTVLKYTNTPGRYSLGRAPILWCFVWNKLIRADLVEDIRFIEGMKFGEDEMFCLECLAKSESVICNGNATTVHHFENEKSLSKTKTRNDIIKFAHALEHFIQMAEDPDAKRLACLRLSEHWSHLFLDMFTGKE